MIVAYLDLENFESHAITEKNKHLLKQAIWIDLLSPSRDEESLVEKCLDLDVPIREEMTEIELSSRLYKEKDSVFMTASIIYHSDTPEPRIDPVSFVLTKDQLITVRYIEPKTFKFFAKRLKKMSKSKRTAPILLAELVEANIDRLADVIEVIGRHLDEYSKVIFKPQSDDADRPDYMEYMKQIGLSGDLTTKVRESLFTFHRLIPYFQQVAEKRIGAEHNERLTTLIKDMVELIDHINFLSNKVTFLLNATLGMVNIEQNNIIKIFSVAAVIFLPPTLIASVYGMNFHFMPELSWKYGYAFAMTLMVLAGWLPYKYFKWRKWL